MSANLKHYLKTIENSLKMGNATEHTHRPALKALLESSDLKITVTNEPKRIACGAPDYIITCNNLTIGYIEAKDVGKPLTETERTDQLKRYLRALNNLILTDYLEFRWYVDGELRQNARLARSQSGGKLRTEKGGIKAVEDLLQNFLAHQPQGINAPKDLAERMARLTRIIRDIIITSFERKQASMLLQGWRDAFAKVLIADLGLPEKTPEFADMFAQTLAYGLFTARVMDTKPNNFTRQEAQYLIPRSNPFLRDFFIQISGPQIDDEPFASFVDDLVNLLASADMEAILLDFGRRKRQEDPIVHFYETFLAAYDPKLREKRGVYYTPVPVVSYIVRSVDHLLKTRFNCSQGLADSSKIPIPNYDLSSGEKGKKQTLKTTESHKVLVLDPATGTGTFLYAVIDHIRQQFIQQGNAGMWPGYVKNHLLPRLFGFELLMAPYAVAHFKLSLQLSGRDLPNTLADQWAYQPTDDERLGVYLTNALEEAHEMTDLPLFTQWVADETNAAQEVKQILPVLVVMGNPPYSGHSANQGQWIIDLLKGKLPEGKKTGSYYEVDGKPLGERNPKWLQDDYVKFIRFGQWRIERSGSGILAFICNNGYLDNPTFRGMRQQLMKSFSDIYILNLHGDSRKKEVPPEGITDENVFDIQQGVSITIFTKKPEPSETTKIKYLDLWGSMSSKYEYLLQEDIKTSTWQLLEPSSPFYLFVPQDINLSKEYEINWKVTDVFPNNSVNLRTHRDKLVIDFDRKQLEQRIQTVNNPEISEEWLRQNYSLRDNRDWSLTQARIKLRKISNWEEKIRLCHYRPFDFRWIFYDNSLVEYPCYPVVGHFRHPNIGFTTTRQTTTLGFEHIIATKLVTELKCASHDRGSYSFPLYLYPTEEATKQKSLFEFSIWPPDELNGRRIPNLNPDFVAKMGQKLGLIFQPFQAFKVLETSKVFTPEDIFYYFYAISHSPTYRIRYAEFLKTDFPRIPLTSDTNLFRVLCRIGKELVGFHLLESPVIGQFSTRFPITGDNRVEKGYPRYTAPQEGQPGRININKTQYFEGISSEVWEFYIGGYQVLHKWLKDRRRRELSYDDLTHYQKVIVSLQKTIELMVDIDNAIPEWPIQ